MKMLFSSVLFFASTLPLSAQTIQTTGNATTKWGRYDADVNMEVVLGKRYSPKSKLLRLSETEVAFPVSYDNSSGAIVFDVPKLKYGVVKLNNKGQQQWEQQIDGLLINISKSGNNILVIYTDQERHREVTKEIKAVLLSGADGKVLQQKKLFTNNSDKFIEPKVFNNKDGELLNLMVRYSNFKGGLAFNTEKKMLQSGKIELYKIRENLEAELTKTIPVEEDFQFLRADMADNGNLFLVFHDDKTVTVQKHDPASISPQVLTTSCNFSKVSRKERIQIKVNPQNPDQLLAVLNFYAVIKYAYFRFDKKNVVEKEEKLDKAYAQQLSEETETFEGFKKRKKMKYIESLVGDFITFYGSQPVIAKELVYSESNGSSVASADLETVISVYDENLNLRKNFIITKEYSSKAGGYGDSYHINGDKFYYLGNNDGLFKAMNVFACIDLKALKLDKLCYLKDSEGKPVSKSPLIPNNTIWFSDGFVIDRRDWSFTKGLASNAKLEVASYN